MVPLRASREVVKEPLCFLAHALRALEQFGPSKHCDNQNKGFSTALCVVEVLAMGPSHFLAYPAVTGPVCEPWKNCKDKRVGQSVLRRF